MTQANPVSFQIHTIYSLSQDSARPSLDQWVMCTKCCFIYQPKMHKQANPGGGLRGQEGGGTKSKYPPQARWPSMATITEEENTQPSAPLGVHHSCIH